MPVDRKNIQACFECGDLSTGRHHVVPVCKGGTKVIPLCTPCHAKVHDGLNMGLSAMIKDGLAKARSNGVVLGPPRKVIGDMPERIRALRATGHGYKRIAQQVGLSVGTVYAFLNRTPGGAPPVPIDA